MSDELTKLREFAASFRVWQKAMTNRSFRQVLAKLADAESARESEAVAGSQTSARVCSSGVCE